MGFPQLLSELRQEKGLTHEQLGKAIGFSKAIIGYWESGKRQPAFDALFALAQYFNVSADYLLGLEDLQLKAARTTLTPQLSERQQILLKYFDALDDLGQGCVIGYAQDKVETKENIDKKNKKA